jgi:hypothetical protein
LCQYLVGAKASPNVLPEAFLAVNSVGGFGRVDGEHVLLAFGAGAFVHLPFASKCHAMAVTTSWTMSGGWQIFALIKVGFGADDQEVSSAVGSAALKGRRGVHSV